MQKEQENKEKTKEKTTKKTWEDKWVGNGRFQGDMTAGKCERKQ